MKQLSSFVHIILLLFAVIQASISISMNNIKIIQGRLLKITALHGVIEMSFPAAITNLAPAETFPDTPEGP